MPSALQSNLLRLRSSMIGYRLPTAHKLATSHTSPSLHTILHLRHYHFTLFRSAALYSTFANTVTTAELAPGSLVYSLTSVVFVATSTADES